MRYDYELDLDMTVTGAVQAGQDPEEIARTVSEIIGAWDEAPADPEGTVMSAGMLTSPDGDHLYHFAGQISDKAWTDERGGTLYLWTTGGIRLRVVGQGVSVFFSENIRPELGELPE